MPYTRYVKTIEEIYQSILNFNASPELWSEAVTSSSEYFVHTTHLGRDLFGTAKFCGLHNVTLHQYIDGIRVDKHGGVAQRRISRLLKKKWATLDSCPSSLRDAFAQWYLKLYVGYDISTNSSAFRLLSVPPQPLATRPPRARHYWALNANPKYYDIQSALLEKDTDLWVTDDKDIRAGDRVAIWRTRDRTKTRGVVALGDVLTDPQLLSDSNNRFWKSPHSGDIPEQRVKIRFVRPLLLPLLLGGPATDILEQLSVKNGQGRVFIITPAQWSELVDVAGGWPDDATQSPEVADAIDRSNELSGKRTRGQGRRISPEERKAVELHAMHAATAHFKGLGWDVTDVSASLSYDLLCTKAEGSELHVEVKGTQSPGESIILTRNEVLHAIRSTNVALYILTLIELTRVPGNIPIASGGSPIVFDPWILDQGDLDPTEYEYLVPK